MQNKNIKKGRTLCLGDIHGGYKTLLQCLERSSFDKEVDTLIQLGDVADGWSQVPECVEELLTIKNLISIKGNHDLWLYDWMKYGNAAKTWLLQGGQASYDAYHHYNPGLTLKHEKEFFAKQHNYYVDDQNRAFVHGGYTSHKGLGHEDKQHIYYWDRKLWATALSANSSLTRSACFMENDSSKLPKLLRPHKEIYIGHTTTGNWGKDVPMQACNVWNLDTGAGFEGKLTLMCVDTKEYWQSDKVSDLYPNEKGR